MRRVLLATTLAGLLSTLAPATVHASAQSVIRDCTDNGRIDSSHSQSDYKGALSGLPSDVDEYTDCRSIIRSAQQRDARSGSTTGGTGSSTGTSGTSGSSGFGGSFGIPPPSTPAGGTPLPPATAAEKAARAAATAAGAQPLKIAGAPITPGASGLGKGVGNQTLPGSLLVVLLAAGLAALAGGLGSRRRGDDDAGGPAPPTGGGEPDAVLDPAVPNSLRGVIGRVFPRRT